MLQRTESERTMLAREYDIAMCGLPGGIGWPALWVAEDAYIEWSETPDAEVGMESLPRYILSVEWLSHLSSELGAPPWTLTPRGGALETLFARAIRWAYHHSYPRPFEVEAERTTAILLDRARAERQVMGESRPRCKEYTCDEVARMVWKAYATGRVAERRAQAQRPPRKRGRRPKGIPPEVQAQRDIRRALLVMFFRARGLPVSRGEGADFRSACDAVALAEAIREKVTQDRESMLCGETAISLLVHTPEVQASREIANVAWDTAVRLVTDEGFAHAEKEEDGTRLWKDARKALDQLAEPVASGLGYESIRRSWQRFKGDLDTLQAARGQPLTGLLLPPSSPP